MVLSKYISFKHLPIISLVLLLFVTTNILNSTFKKPKLDISIQESSYTFNQNVLKLFTLGNRRLVSSVLWTKTLLESDTTHTKISERSWMYYKFDTISELDPYFFENYLFGGIYLSIIKNDLIGAAALYEKGLIQYPTDYQLLYNTAFNYFYEMNNAAKALEKYMLLKDHPYAKSHFKLLPKLILKLKNKERDPKLAFNLLFKSYQLMTKGIVKERTSQSLFFLKAEIDLACLNSGSKACARRDFFGNDYILDNGIYRIKK